jgi:hypothetical protein
MRTTCSRTAKMVIDFSHCWSILRQKHIIGEVRMTKVEELRDKIYTKAAAHIGILESEFSCSPDENRTYEELTRELATDLYALISAAHAEGVAEGEERERMRIWMLRDTVSGNPNDRVIFVPMKALMSPSSVLAPPVTGTTAHLEECGTSGLSSAGSATSSGGYWKKVYVPPPETNIANAPTKEKT